MATGRCPGSGALPQLSRGVPYISAALARPSLAAWEAAAWRVGAPSFPSTAETRWSIVLAEMKSFCADLGVGVPGSDQREHLALAPGQAERMLGRGVSLAGRDRANVQPTQRTTDDDGSGGAEILADVHGLAEAGSCSGSWTTGPPTAAPPRLSG